MTANRNYLLLLFVHLCVLGAARITGAQHESYEFRNDYIPSEKADGWLKLHRVPLDWHTARIQCYHEGAVLASPLTPELMSALTELIENATPSLTTVFSGVSATFSDSVFSSVEGVPLDNLFMDWDALNNYEKQLQCLGIVRDKMAYYNCKDMLPYICYRQFSTSDVLTDCGTVDKAYKLDSRTGHCYKFHELAETWSRAVRVCQAEGAHLAVIDSEAEAAVVRDLFAAHPHRQRTFFKDSAFVGFAQWDDGSWWTLHGKMLEHSGYSRWTGGQPDNLWGGRAKTGQACGAIFRTGLLDDAWCDEPMAFICEKDVYSLVNSTGVIY